MSKKSFKKIDKIELSQEERIKQIKGALKTGKKFRSQHDESSAGAAIATKEELDIVKQNKLKERIRYQSRFHELYLASMYAFVELEELTNLYNSYEKSDVGKFELFNGDIIEGKWKLKKDSKGNITHGYIELPDGKEVRAADVRRTFYFDTPALQDEHKPKTGFGLPYSKKMLLWEYKIKEHKLKEAMGELLYMEQELKKLGFSDVQIDKAKVEGEFVKDIDLLEKMESDWVEKNIIANLSDEEKDGLPSYSKGGENK